MESPKEKTNTQTAVVLSACDAENVALATAIYKHLNSKAYYGDLCVSLARLLMCGLATRELLLELIILYDISKQRSKYFRQSNLTSIW